jgi:hypothetical protein
LFTLDYGAIFEVGSANSKSHRNMLDNKYDIWHVTRKKIIYPCGCTHASHPFSLSCQLYLSMRCCPIQKKASGTGAQDTNQKNHNFVTSVSL